eukprot:6174058-Pleurochrysis_carterae.AAC.1
MHWDKPRTEQTGAELLNSVTIAVDDVNAALDAAAAAGMRVEPAVTRVLPLYGEVAIGAAFVDGDSRVEFCCFASS